MLAHASLAKESPVQNAAKISSKPENRNEQFSTKPLLSEHEFTAPRFFWSIGKVAVSAPSYSRTDRSDDARPAPGGSRFARLPWPIQAKLEVGTVDDPLEREADRVAEQVMRMRDPMASTNSTARGSSSYLQTGRPEALEATLQRKCSCGGSCDKCKAEQADDEHANVQRKPVPQISAIASSPSSAGMTAPPIVHEVLRSAGQPLDAGTRAFFEPRFGYDFGSVRLHTDSRATESAARIHANAYAVGNNLVVANGRCAANTHAGRLLLAHELTHVIQQAQLPLPRVQRDNPHKQDPPVMRPAQKEGPGGEVAAQETEIERRWKKWKGAATGFSEIRGWITAGDAVVALMIDHETGYFNAIHAQDAELAATYKSVIETDILAYRYISWHVLFYLNLLEARSPVNSLIAAFNADNRDFTGRHAVEEEVKALKKLIDFVPKDSATHLSALVTNHVYKYREGRANEVLITVTSAADKRKRKEFDDEVEKVIKLQLTIQGIADRTTQFLRRATKEGFWQAVEAVKEYVEVRRGIIDSDNSGPDYSEQSSGSGTGSGQGSGSGSGSGAGSGSGSGSGQQTGTEPETKPEKKKQKESKSTDYLCTAKCQQQCPTGVEGYISGTSSKNCSEATQKAKKEARSGCYPRHCSCKDTDGFIGKGTQCENHTR